MLTAWSSIDRHQLKCQFRRFLKVTSLIFVDQALFFVCPEPWNFSRDVEKVRNLCALSHGLRVPSSGWQQGLASTELSAFDISKPRDMLDHDFALRLLLDPADGFFSSLSSVALAVPEDTFSFSAACFSFLVRALLTAPSFSNCSICFSLNSQSC